MVHKMRIENKTETSNILSTIKASKEQGNKGRAGQMIIMGGGGVIKMNTIKYCGGVRQIMTLDDKG